MPISLSYNTGPALNSASCGIQGTLGVGGAFARIANDAYTVDIHVTGVVQLSVAGEIRLTCDTGSFLYTMRTAKATLTAIAVAIAP